MNQAEYLLALMRCTVLRLRLQQAEIEQVGVSLRGGVIDPNTAVNWLTDLGVLGEHVEHAVDVSGVGEVRELAQVAAP
jgi:hypothetical protein